MLQKNGVQVMEIDLENMKTFQLIELHLMCMSCLSQGPLASVSDLVYEQRDFATILNDLFINEVNINDNKSQQLCEKCIKEIIQFYNFKRNFHQMQEIIKHFYYNNNSNDNCDNVENNDCGKEVITTVETCEDKDEPQTCDNIIESSTLIPFTDINAVQTELKSFGYVLKGLDTGDLALQKVPHIKKLCSKLYRCSCNKVFHSNMAYVRHQNRSCNACVKFSPSSGIQKRYRRLLPKTQRPTTTPIPIAIPINIPLPKYPIPKSYICQVCKRRFFRKNSLRQHMDTHEFHLCEFCGQTFTRMNAFSFHRAQHMRPSSSKNPDPDHSQVCEYCVRTFPNLTSLKKHIDRHKGRPRSPSSVRRQTRARARPTSRDQSS